MEYFAIGLIVVLIIWFVLWLAIESIEGNRIAAVVLALSLSAIIGWAIWMAENEVNTRNSQYSSFCQGVKQ